MLETCKCGQNKIKTEVDGRFAYQVCNECNDVLNIVYLGSKEDKEIEEPYDESLLGI